jgi:hypothetical protein
MCKKLRKYILKEIYDIIVTLLRKSATFPVPLELYSGIVEIIILLRDGVL